MSLFNFMGFKFRIIETVGGENRTYSSYRESCSNAADLQNVLNFISLI